MIQSRGIIHKYHNIVNHMSLTVVFKYYSGAIEGRAYDKFWLSTKSGIPVCLFVWEKHRRTVRPSVLLSSMSKIKTGDPERHEAEDTTSKLTDAVLLSFVSPCGSFVCRDWCVTNNRHINPPRWWQMWPCVKAAVSFMATRHHHYRHE